MGAGESVIRNLDKRTARREHREVFVRAIEEYREKFCPTTGTGNFDVVENSRIGVAHDYVQNDQVVRVCVRKRPIFEHELSENEFDVVTCLSKEDNQVVVHDCRMQADMRNRFVDHHAFDFNETFGENDNSDVVFETVCAPLVDIVTTLHGNGTVLMYGQTGSGKTYTMSHIYQRASREIFEKSKEQQAFVSFIELAGDTCYDVLNKHQKLQLMTCPNGDVMAYPATQVPVHSAQELHDCIRFACSLRSTAATGVHDASSRSHAICRIEMVKGNALTLVDLAGSEMRIDSAEHDATRRKESAQINSSLMKLKECVRASAMGSSYIPFRQSKLTHVLRPAFVGDEDCISRTVVIATVSPSSKDSEHTLNTLRHACIMDGQEPTSKETRWVTGGKTFRQDLEPVDVTALARKKKAQRDKIRDQISGRDNGGQSSWGGPPSKHHSKDGSFDKLSKALEKKKAEKLALKRRNQAESNALKTMHQATINKLVEARANAGRLQQKRIGELKRLEWEKQRSSLEKPQPPTIRKKMDKQKQLSVSSNNNRETTQNLSSQKQESRENANNNNNNNNSGVSQQEYVNNLLAKVWGDDSIPQDQKEFHFAKLMKQYMDSKNVEKIKPKEPETNNSSSSSSSSSSSNRGTTKYNNNDDDEYSRKSPRRTTSTTADPNHELDRHQVARLQREKLIEEENRRKAEKLQAKLGNKTAGDTRSEIFQLEQQIRSETNKMTLYGLKQKLAKAKAKLLREQRAKEKRQIQNQQVASQTQIHP